MSGLIVCGVDDSDEARDAAHVAAWLCRELDSRLALLHVAAPPATPGLASAGYAYPGERDYEAAIEAGRVLFDGIVAELHMDEVVASQVVVGDPADRLRAFALNKRSNLAHRPRRHVRAAAGQRRRGRPGADRAAVRGTRLRRPRSRRVT